MNITQRLVKSLKAPDEGNVVHYDGEIPGFGVRITAAGAVSFVLNYRIDGRERRYTIGRSPEWTAEAAREEAKTLRYDISKGTDPLAEKEAKRSEPLMRDLVHDYLVEHAEKNKRHGSIRVDRSMLDQIILPRLGVLKVVAITRRDIERLHGSLKRTPVRANRVLALLSKMFNLAVGWSWREDNPVRGIERYQEGKRDTWLSLDQLRQLERALQQYPDQSAADAVRLLIVTGAREGEVLKAEWPQFDLERGVWTKPSHHTKQKKTEHVPLSRAALSILDDMHEHRNGSNYLFPGKQGPRVTLRKPWIQITKAAGLAEAYEKPGKRRMLTKYRPTVHIHDLRHTFASHLVQNGQSLYVVGKLLGHTSPQTTARYAHVDDKALRATTDNFGKVYRSLHK